MGAKKDKKKLPEIAVRYEESLNGLKRTIGESAALVNEYSSLEGRREETMEVEAIPSLLDQCNALLAKADSEHPPPIRIIHHFACTGGTLISKCLSSMPNTLLLSEVHPFSPLGYKKGDCFSPTDLLRLCECGSRVVDDSLKQDVFLAGIREIYTYACSRGLHLILREHSHSQYCVGEKEAEYPDLSRILKREFDVVSLVSVRHPLDSYLSLMRRNWIHFDPGDIDEYSRRYLLFLERHEGSPVFKYEDLVEDPDATLEKMCNIFKMEYSPEYEAIFSSIRLSGDSGRRGDKIGRRKRRDVPKSVLDRARESDAYKSLLSRMSY